MASISINSLAHSYYSDPKEESDYAIKSIDYQWTDGGAYALLGPSGCGKTTLLNIISGLLTPSRGSIRFNDNDVTHLPPEERNIAQVFQFPVIYDTMTVAENLAFPLSNRGMDRSDIQVRVSQMLETLNLSTQANRRAKQLTADEKQKISLGRGLIRQDVNAILFDEPLTVIDPLMKWELRTQLKQIHQQLKHTMIYVTHDQTEALTFADKVVVMHEGEVVQIGTPEELFNEPAHTFVGHFIGSPGMNILPLSLDGNHASINGFPISLDLKYKTPELARIELGIRPEHITIKAASGTRAPDFNELPVTVQRVNDIGRHLIVNATLGDHSINLVAPEGTAIPEHKAFITFEPGRAIVFANSHKLQADRTP